ncbi:MAG: VOC family protein [Nitrospinaceae bacterium]|jgi:catechol 2,3-dioxygenase-like lactoylglutathione lyase family enzyme|nr:VOC family protein [Nitrospinaceae bacterium]MBT3433845.1 VOC family protein [Nitrospinaceae bacterium]MBT3821986.1 VOC family protein [Nitrospinaceae bacterium]MBT4095729.1 VOC family protein [Nitrospinaceae bacterium]MBT4429736.1 VOC family protein [Nitrospinaceae bacterium]
MAITGFHNISLTVSDAGEAAKWYGDKLGFEVQSDSERTPEFSEAVTGVKGATLRVVHLNGHGLHFELMQYVTGSGAQVETSPNNIGSAQVGFLTDNGPALYEEWKANGIKMWSPGPAEVPNGPMKGGFIFFCQDLDGNVLKFMQTPK